MAAPAKVASLLGAAGGSTTVSAAALSTAPGRRRRAPARLRRRWSWFRRDGTLPGKAARVIHAGAALWVGKNAGVGTLREAISRGVDDHGYRAGARLMAAALAARRGDGLIAGVPGAAAELVVPAAPGARG